MRPDSAGGAARRGGAYHWDVYGIEDLLPASEAGRDVLLLGCGDGGERPHLAGLGFRSVGLDVKPSPGADLVADAHALPLKSASFDVVLSMQVLEHLRAPWIAVDEVARVLRPGGWFVGSVAFLKPYHNSYFHMTHDGVRTLLNSAGISVDRMRGAQSLAYTFFGSFAPVGPLQLRRWAFGWMDSALLGLRAFLWSVTRRRSPYSSTQRFDEELGFSFSAFDKLRYAPAVVFRGRKER